MKKTKFFLLFLCWMIFLSSCAPSFQALVRKKEATPQELLALFAQREKERQSVKGMVSLSIFPLHGLKQSLSGILSFENENHLRFQGFDPFGRTVVDLSLSDNLYKVTQGGNPPLKGNLSGPDGFELRISPDDRELFNWNEWLKTMKELRWGGNPPLRNDEVIFIDQEGDNLLCSIFKIKGKQGILRKKIWLERSFFFPVKEELYEESPRGGIQLIGSIYFEKYKEKNNGSWPGQIKVKLLDGEYQVEFLEMNFSPAFPSDYFNVN